MNCLVERGRVSPEIARIHTDGEGLRGYIMRYRETGINVTKILIPYREL